MVAQVFDSTHINNASQNFNFHHIIQFVKQSWFYLLQRIITKNQEH